MSPGPHQSIFATKEWDRRLRGAFSCLFQTPSLGFQFLSSGMQSRGWPRSPGVDCQPAEHAWDPGSAPFLDPKAGATREVLPPKSSGTGPSSFHVHVTCRTLHKIYSCRDPGSFVDSWGDFVFNPSEPHLSPLKSIAQAGSIPEGLLPSADMAWPCRNNRKQECQWLTVHGLCPHVLDIAPNTDLFHTASCMLLCK